MDLRLVFLLLAAACLVAEAFDLTIVIHPKWWALGVAFYLLSLTG